MMISLTLQFDMVYRKGFFNIKINNSTVNRYEKIVVKDERLSSATENINQFYRRQKLSSHIAGKIHSQTISEQK